MAHIFIRLCALVFTLSAIAVPCSYAASDAISIYTTVPEKYAFSIMKRFTEQTGVKVNFLRLSSGEMLTRLLSEKSRPQVDAIVGGPSDIYAVAKREGVFAPYLPPEAEGIPAQFRDADNAWFGIGIMPLCFLSNRNFLAKQGLPVPTSWQDLLDSRYAGSFQMADARTSGTASERIYALVKIYGEDEAFAYQKKLHKNVQMYTKSGAGGALPIAMGQASGGVFYYVDVMDLELQGYPVAISFPSEGVTYAVEGCAMLKGAKNPDGARKLMDWMASENFARIMLQEKAYYVPSRPALQKLNKLMDLSNITMIEADVFWKSANRKRFIERWIAEVASEKN